MALTPEQLRRQITQTLEPGPLVDSRQQAIDDGYKPGSGFMYEDKFYGSLNPGRRSMDMAPLDMLLRENPAAKAAFEAGGNQMVMNPNPNPQMGPGTGMPAGPNGMTPDNPGKMKGFLDLQPGIQGPGLTPGPPDPNFRPTYSGSMMGGADNPYSSLINDYTQSDYFDSSPFENAPNAVQQYSMQDPIFGQITGGYNPYDTQGFNDFLENSYGNMQTRMQNRDVKSQEFMDKFDLYGDAYNTRFPGENPGMPDFITGGTAPDGTAQLPGPIVDPNINPFDPEPNMPGFNIGGPAPQEPNMPDTTDIFGAGNNPINNNPIAPMPSPITPPPGMDSGHSHGDLLSGIGKLFEQYFPQQGGGNNQFNQPATQPVFDAAGNSTSGGQTQSNQVFGNMITPDFGSY